MLSYAVFSPFMFISYAESSDSQGQCPRIGVPESQQAIR